MKAKQPGRQKPARPGYGTTRVLTIGNLRGELDLVISLGHPGEHIILLA